MENSEIKGVEEGGEDVGMTMNEDNVDGCKVTSEENDGEEKVDNIMSGIYGDDDSDGDTARSNDENKEDESFSVNIEKLLERDNVNDNEVLQDDEEIERLVNEAWDDITDEIVGSENEEINNQSELLNERVSTKEENEEEEVDRKEERIEEGKEEVSGKKSNEEEEEEKVAEKDTEDVLVPDLSKYISLEEYKKVQEMEQTLKKQHEEEMNSVTQKIEEEIGEVKKKHEEELTTLREQIEEEKTKTEQMPDLSNYVSLEEFQKQKEEVEEMKRMMKEKEENEEIMKKNHEEEKVRLEEKLEEQFGVEKSRLTEEIEKLRRNNSELLEEKENHIKSIKEEKEEREKKHMEEIESMEKLNEEFEKKLEEKESEIKLRVEEKENEMKKIHNEEMEITKKSLEEEYTIKLDELRTSVEENEEAKKQMTGELENMKTDLEGKITKLEKEKVILTSEIEEMEQVEQERIKSEEEEKEKIIKNYEEKIEKKETEFEETKRKMEVEFEEKKEITISKLRDEFNNERTRMKEGYEEKISKMTEEHNLKVTNLVDEHEKELKRIEEEHSSRERKLREELEEMRKGMDGSHFELSSLRREVWRLREDRDGLARTCLEKARMERLINLRGNERKSFRRLSRDMFVHSTLQNRLEAAEKWKIRVRIDLEQGQLIAKERMLRDSESRRKECEEFVNDLKEKMRVAMFMEKVHKENVEKQLKEHLFSVNNEMNMRRSEEREYMMVTALMTFHHRSEKWYMENVVMVEIRRKVEMRRRHKKMGEERQKLEEKRVRLWYVIPQERKLLEHRRCSIEKMRRVLIWKEIIRREVTAKARAGVERRRIAIETRFRVGEENILGESILREKIEKREAQRARDKIAELKKEVEMRKLKWEIEERKGEMKEMMHVELEYRKRRNEKAFVMRKVLERVKGRLERMKDEKVHRMKFKRRLLREIERRKIESKNSEILTRQSISKLQKIIIFKRKKTRRKEKLSPIEKKKRNVAKLKKKMEKIKSIKREMSRLTEMEKKMKFLEEKTLRMIDRETGELDGTDYGEGNKTPSPHRKGLRSSPSSSPSFSRKSSGKKKRNLSSPSSFVYKRNMVDNYGYQFPRAKRFETGRTPLNYVFYKYTQKNGKSGKSGKSVNNKLKK